MYLLKIVREMKVEGPNMKEKNVCERKKNYVDVKLHLFFSVFSLHGMYLQNGVAGASRMHAVLVIGKQNGRYITVL